MKSLLKAVGFLLLTQCADASFQAGYDRDKPKNDDSTPSTSNETIAVDEPAIATDTADTTETIEEPSEVVCTENFLVVPAQSNPYHAKTQNDEAIQYDINETTFIDDYASTKPTLFMSAGCIQAGKVLGFNVKSDAKNGPIEQAAVSADGVTPRNNYQHLLGPYRGISDITANINSLVGVFVSDDPIGAALPEPLDFSDDVKTNFLSLSPMLNQLFFIGNGLTAEGLKQKFVVPAGATKLYLGSMDAYEWKNNTGSHAVQLLELRN